MHRRTISHPYLCFHVIITAINTYAFSSNTIELSCSGFFWQVGQYSTNWFSKGFFRLSDFKPIIHCELCKFTVRNHQANSSPRDVILTGMFSQSYNIIPMLRTLRSTGSTCSVVVFVDTDLLASLDTHIREEISRCGCTLIDIGTLASRDRNHLFMLRNAAVYDFLRPRRDLFNRILLIDLFDTVFQGDPFTEEITENLIGFSQEVGVMRGNHVIAGTILVGVENCTKYIAWKPVVNCGTIIGTSKSILIFLKLFFQTIQHINYDNYERLIATKFPDQAIVNVLVRMNLLANEGLNVVLFQHHGYVSMYRTYHYGYDFRLGHYRPNASLPFPLVLHNYDRTQPGFCISLLKACPPMNRVKNYSRC